ncbi:MAG: arginine--tRNA ligase [Haloferacaceae archaeon]
MRREFRAEVEAALTAALADLDLPTDDLGVERPPEDVSATLASSVAYRLAGELGAPPPACAEQVAAAVSTEGYDYLADVTTLGPYLNFEVTDRYFADTLAGAQDEGWGELPPTGDRVVVEHTSANPTGPVHVGRARNPIIGDALARLLDYAGNDVDRQYYVNDVGRQVAVFTWAYDHFDEDDLPEPEREKPDYDLVRYYRAGSELLESGDSEAVAAAEEEVTAIIRGLEAGDEATYERVGEVVDTVLAGMRETLGRLPAEFDEFVKESRFVRSGATEELVARLKELDEAVYEEEAWQLDLGEHGIEKNLVFLRSDGTSLYPTRDLAYHEWKLSEYDRAVTVLGEDHRLQADQLRTTLSLLGADVSGLDQVFYSWVNLPGGGMSTREGTGVDLDDLLDEAVSRARDEVARRREGRDRAVAAEEVETIARQVGVGAVRYDVVSKQPTKGITFEWDRALDFEAQSAPYVQYVHARCRGIEERADGVPAAPDAAGLTEPSERALLHEIARLPAVVERAADDLSPHVVATYTRDVAEAFNAFYRECPVLDAPDDLRGPRLALVRAARNAVANSLDVLGVEAPRAM